MPGAAKKRLARHQSSGLFGSAGSFSKKHGKGFRALTVPIQLWRKYGVLLLWSAVGIDLLVSIAGYPRLGQLFSMVCVFFFLAEYVSLRKAVCSFWFAMMDVFFREISIGGAHKVERLEDGRAVIFACAPHVNQFVDPIVVMKVVAQTTQRHVSWMIAEKSYHRRPIGDFAKAMKTIPVMRPEDNAKQGSGFVTTDGIKVYGHAGTHFVKDFKKGSVLVVKGDGRKRTAKVARVLSEFEMELAGPMKEQTEVVLQDKTQAFHRAPSPLTTALLVCCVFVPIAAVLLQLEPALLAAVGLEVHRTWPLMLLVSLQLSTILVSLIYWLKREGFRSATPLGQFISSEPTTPANSHSGDSSRDFPTPGSTPTTSASDLSRENKPRSPTSESKKAAAPKELPEEVEVEANDVTEPAQYMVLPYVDQSEMFEQVHDALLSGGTIGIFPEGGTHDGTTLLPLKWGISTMLLGALAKHQGDAPPPQISVVPVGLNYFKPHDFRSTVSVDFGDPIEVDVSLARQWRDGSKEEQKEANVAVMELIMAGVNACTLQAKDVETLELFRTIRRLYVPLGARLSVADNVALTQGVAYGFERIKNEDKVKAFLQRCNSYTNMLRQRDATTTKLPRILSVGARDAPLTLRWLLQTGIVDYQVQRFQGMSLTEEDRSSLLSNTLYRLAMFGVFGVLLVPAYLWFSPPGLWVSSIADYQARKVGKRSVMGTWKVLSGVGVIPLYHIVTTIAVWSTFGEFAGLTWFFIAPFGGIMAIVANEQSYRLLRSLKALVFVLGNKDAGEELFDRREQLRSELKQLQAEFQWLHGLDFQTKERLLARQSFSDRDLEGDPDAAAATG